MVTFLWLIKRVYFFDSLCIYLNRVENQALIGAIPFCGEYPFPRFDDKFRSANQMDGIQKLAEIKWLPDNF